MLIGTGRGQQKRGIVARFLVPTCIVMNKNVFMCMHWIALNVFKLVLALQKLFQNNYHRRKAKNRIFTKSTDTVTALKYKIPPTYLINGATSAAMQSFCTHINTSG